MPTAGTTSLGLLPDPAPRGPTCVGQARTPGKRRQAAGVAGPLGAVPARTPGSAGRVQRVHSTLPGQRRHGDHALLVPLAARRVPGSPARWRQREGGRWRRRSQRTGVRGTPETQRGSQPHRAGPPENADQLFSTLAPPGRFYTFCSVGPHPQSLKSSLSDYNEQLKSRAAKPAIGH